MKQLSNFIRIMPLSDYESFDGTNMSGSTEPDLILAKNNLQYDEVPQPGSAGVIFNQSLGLITDDKLNAAQRKKYANLRPVVVLIFDENGVPVLWGTDDERLRIMVTPKPDRDVLEFDRKSVTPLF